jgi:sodium/potassium/calcium exchanger 6
MMNQLPSFLHPAVRKPRYSIRPFYTSLLVFALIATAKFLFTSTTNEYAQVAQPGTGPHGHLFKREGELEVSFLSQILSCEMAPKAK